MKYVEGRRHIDIWNDGLTGGKIKVTLEEKICDLCNGTGSGNGCFEQGGGTYGLCSKCCGYGGWFYTVKKQKFGKVK